MKTYFYLVRHGKTVFNQMGRFQGCCDSELLPESVALAESVGKGLAGISFARAASSTSERAIDTMHAILGDRDVPRVYSKKLKEICFGQLEGALEEFAPIPKETLAIGFSFCGGEDKKEAAERFRKGLEEVAVEGNVLVVAHAAVIAELLKAIDENCTFAHANDIVPHCSVTILKYENGELSIEELPSMKYKMQ